MAKKKRSGLGSGSATHASEVKKAARYAESWAREVQQKDCTHALDSLLAANTTYGQAVAHRKSVGTSDIVDHEAMSNARDMIDESTRWFIRKCVKK